MGVWISGFFGSGKSHFLKMLSYILENREVKGIRTVERFREKFAEDPATFMMIDKATRAKTEAILFNIDIEGSINKDKTAVLRVFAKMFYNHLGFYGDNLKVAMLEHYIDQQGKTEAFRQAFEARSGKAWVAIRKAFAFNGKHIVPTLVEVLDISEEDARAWFSDKSPIEFSIAQLVSDIKEYVNKQPKNFRLLFMIDEVGQYVGTDTDMLLNLQSLTEKLGSECQGKVWVICTGQEAIDEIIKVRADEFSRIQARFKTRLNKVASQQRTINTPAQLHLAVMSAICGLKNSQPAAILRAVLNAGLTMDGNSIYSDIVNYGAKDAFWTLIAQATGYSEIDVDLGNLACHILMTACTRTMKTDNLTGLEKHISMPHQAWCFDFVSDWLHSDEKQGLYTITRFVEGALHLHDRFMQTQVSELADTECFPCVNECILEKIMQDIQHQIIDADAIINAVEKRRTCVWYDAVATFYDGILQVANMQRFFTDHAAGFHTVEARNVWKEYTTDYYRMDGYYRQFHLCYAESLKIYKERLNDLFAKVAEQVECLYVHWFLDSLGENWTGAVEEDLRNHGKILEVPCQTEFYANKVRTADSRVVVIISDALRYEVAASLTEQLRRETQSKVELTAMQGIFPTITKFGMAALLPHRKLTVEEKANGNLSIHADGIPTDSNYRDKVLKAANTASIALQYKDIAGMSTEQLRSLTNGMEVVYIYHDTIDAASHASDSMVFSACDTAIMELQNLVRIATNRMNRTHVK